MSSHLRNVVSAGVNPEREEWALVGYQPPTSVVGDRSPNTVVGDGSPTNFVRDRTPTTLLGDRFHLTQFKDANTPGHCM